MYCSIDNYEYLQVSKRIWINKVFKYGYQSNPINEPSAYVDIWKLEGIFVIAACFMFRQIWENYFNLPFWQQVALYHMACQVGGIQGLEEVTFLYKLTLGACPKSYGVNVARLAGKSSSFSFYSYMMLYCQLIILQILSSNCRTSWGCASKSCNQVARFWRNLWQILEAVWQHQ